LKIDDTLRVSQLFISLPQLNIALKFLIKATAIHLQIDYFVAHKKWCNSPFGRPLIMAAQSLHVQGNSFFFSPLLDID